MDKSCLQEETMHIPSHTSRIPHTHSHPLWCSHKGWTTHSICI